MIYRTQNGVKSWNPHRLGLIKYLEKVQMRATKFNLTQ